VFFILAAHFFSSLAKCAQLFVQFAERLPGK
jgi:hypothetical protein